MVCTTPKEGHRISLDQLRELHARRGAAAIRDAKFSDEEIPRLVVGIDHAVGGGGEEISHSPAEVDIAAPVSGSVFYHVVSPEASDSSNVSHVSCYYISILINTTNDFGVVGRRCRRAFVENSIGIVVYKQAIVFLVVSIRCGREVPENVTVIAIRSGEIFTP